MSAEDQFLPYAHNEWSRGRLLAETSIEAVAFGKREILDRLEELTTEAEERCDENGNWFSDEDEIRAVALRDAVARLAGIEAKS